jgi:hypothetical protein
MALLILGHSECPICGVHLQKDDEIFATSGCWTEPDHPLFEFQDAAMHRNCFDAWPLRAEFVASFNQYYTKQPVGAREMLEDGSIRALPVKET